MIAILFILLIVVGASAACAYLTARKVFRILKAENSSWTWPVSIFVFLLVGGIILYLVVRVLDSVIPFGR
jgi:hypothetical protein